MACCKAVLGRLCAGTTKVESLADHEERSKVTSKGRKCTDLACILLFAVFCVGWMAIAYIGFKSGDPYRLFYGQDYEDNVCGSKNGAARLTPYPIDYTDKKLTYYPRLNEDLVKFKNDNPELNPYDLSSLSFEKLSEIQLTGVCVETCPKQFDVVCTRAWLRSADGGGTASTDGTPPSQAVLTNKCYQNWQNRASDETKMCNHCWISLLNTTQIMFRCLEVLVEDKGAKRTCIFPEQGGEVEEGGACLLESQDSKTETQKPAYPNPVAQFLGSVGSTMGTWMKDAASTWIVIGAVGIGFSVFLGFTWITFLRFFAGYVIYSTICAFFSVSFVALLFVWLKTGFFGTDNFLFKSANTMMGGSSSNFDQNGTQAGNSSGSNDGGWTDEGYSSKPSLDLHASTNTGELTMYRVAAVGLTTCYVIILILFLFARKKINVAIAIIKEASKVLAKMPLLVLFPLITTFCICLNYAWFAGIGAMLVSATDLDVAAVLKPVSSGNASADLSMNLTGTNQETGTGNLAQILQWYHFFGFLWVGQIIMGVSILVISGAVSQFYWTRPNKDGGKDLGKFPIASAYFRAVRFHFGSVVFGGAIIALVQLARYALMYLDHHTKWMQDKNKVLKLMFKVVQCCLWCFEKSIKYITKNAYIMVAMRGRGFCPSAVSAFKLMVKNVGQFVVAIFVSKVIVILGKVLIVGSSFLAGFLWMSKGAQFQDGGKDEISSAIAPSVIVVLVSYLVASSFLHVYELAMDTLLVCFLEDFRDNCSDSDKKDLSFMPDSLRMIVLHQEGHTKTQEEVDELLGKSSDSGDKKGSSGKGSEARVTAFDDSDSDDDL